jgi:hypothetical protein
LPTEFLRRVGLTAASGHITRTCSTDMPIYEHYEDTGVIRGRVAKATRLFLFP